MVIDMEVERDEQYAHQKQCYKPSTSEYDASSLSELGLLTL